MLKTFFTTYLPTPGQKIAFAVVASILLAYLCAVPFQGQAGIMIYKMYYHVGGHFLANASVGDTDYTHLRPSDENYYKMSPLFAIVPLWILSLIPRSLSSVIWQLLSFTVYLVGILSLFSSLRSRPEKTSIFFAFVFSLVILFDLNANGAYLQSNAIIAGLMLLGLAFYRQGRLVLSGAVLSLSVNYKLLPIIAVLLLATGLRWRFVVSFAGFLTFWIMIPAVAIGWKTNLEFLSSWARILATDTSYRYGDQEVHFQYGLRAFLQSNWGLVPGPRFNLIPFAFGLVAGLGFLLRFRTLTRSSFQLLLVLSISYILLFNTRTEGPSTVFMGAAYGILFINLLRFSERSKHKATAFVFWIFFAVLFFTLSLSITDFGKVLHVNRIFWNYNLRTLGVAALFLVSLLSVFVDPLRGILFGTDNTPLPLSRSEFAKENDAEN